MCLIVEWIKTPDMTSSASNNRVYAGFWRRFMAFVIDNIALAIVMVPFGDVILNADIHLDTADPVHLQQQLIQILGSAGMLTMTAISAAMIIGFWIFRAATPGKMLVNAHIVDANTFRPASNARLAVRYVGYFISSAAFGLGFLWIAFDKRKQGWHDKLAGTVVILGKPEPGLQDAGQAP